MSAPLRMGTRASALARAQSGAAAAKLTAATGVAVEVVLVRTEGDQLSTEGRAPGGGDTVGVFTRALDDALRQGRIDFAVHSLKDVPTEEPEGILLAAVPARADVRDALVVASRLAGVASIAALPHGARIATSSPRRVAQLLHARPDLLTAPLAGNVDTRLRKLEDGAADALLLACAGLDRLGLSARIAARLEVEDLLPAPGQGALAMTCRADDGSARDLLATQDDRSARATALAERSFLKHLRGGCRAPVGAHAVLDGERLHLRGVVLSVDGTERLAGESEGTIADPHSAGRRLAEALIARGADRLVTSARDEAGRGEVP